MKYRKYNQEWNWEKQGFDLILVKEGDTADPDFSGELSSEREPARGLDSNDILVVQAPGQFLSFSCSERATVKIVGRFPEAQTRLPEPPAVLVQWQCWQCPKCLRSAVLQNHGMVRVRFCKCGE